jgi:hypothetical protein
VTLQPKTETQTSGSFSGEAGHSYQVRMRSWQTRQEGYNSDIDMPGVWQEATVTLGGTVSGKVLYSYGNGVLGATVSAAGTAAAAVSGLDGEYSLVLGGGTFSLTATTDEGWHTREPVSVTVTLSDTIPLTLTLSPPDDFVQNGGFAGNLDGWTSSLSQTEIVTDGARSGGYSLRISGSGTLSQSSLVSDVFRPIMSFWYKVEGGDGDDVMTVQIAGDPGLPTTEPLTLPTATADWTLGSLGLVLSDTEVYSGDLEVLFLVTQTGLTPTQYYLDDVSFGGSWNSLRQVYLPLVLK